MLPSRRQFLQRASVSGALVALGLTGCRRLEESVADVAFGPEDAAAVPPRDGSIDDVAHLLNRITFGPRPGDRAEVARLGREAFLAQQLDAESINDARCDLRVGAIEPAVDLHGEARAELYEHTPEQILLALGRSRIVRATHSKRQLFEVMVEFWSDHFNIVAGKGECKWMRVADEVETVRRHALGNFRDLVRASATSPAMLIYLDGHDNKVVHPHDHPNENYARELLELHTLGVDGGYTQRDVFEAARCLSGWTYGHHFWQGRISDVAFDPKRHDDGSKEVFGRAIPAGGGERDVDALLDIICPHPSTARNVARRLCRAFVADPAPPELVASIAQAFRDSDGDIKATLRAIFASDEFSRARGSLFKRPFRYVVSALRATAAQTDGGPPVLDALRRMGHAPSEYPTPDGYPLEPEPWMGGLFWRWNFAADLARNAMNGTYVDAKELSDRFGSKEATLAHIFGRAPTSDERDVIVDSTDPLALAMAAPAFQWH